MKKQSKSCIRNQKQPIQALELFRNPWNMIVMVQPLKEECEKQVQENKNNKIQKLEKNKDKEHVSFIRKISAIGQSLS